MQINNVCIKGHSVSNQKISETFSAQNVDFVPIFMKKDKHK